MVKRNVRKKKNKVRGREKSRSFFIAKSVKKDYNGTNLPMR